MTDEVEAAVAAAFREEWSQLVATLIRQTGDWDLAEDCAQEAFAVALDRWRRDGIPTRPGAWLTTTARNRATDHLRRQAVGRAKLAEVATLLPDDDSPEQHDVQDDRLRLIFTCCHPALDFDARVALTLRVVAGLTTPEIARAFLAAEPAMAQRIVRAKRKIRDAGIPYRVPPADLLPERTAGVLAVLYLLFNEGYSASAGADLIRKGLTEESIRLTRLLTHLMPDESEVSGLLALMLLHDARRSTRVDASGVLITLDEQDRAQWNQAQVAEGTQLLRALPRDLAGPYRIQAEIAACHAIAPDFGSTDWRRIIGLYDELSRVAPSPVVALNRAVAVAMADGPSAGLAIVDALEASGSLAGYHLLPATRADLLRRQGRISEAAAAYRDALGLAATDAERAYLTRRLAQVAG